MIYLVVFKEVVCGFAGYLYRINLGLVLRLGCIYRRPWALLGFVLGPLAYPLFTTHRHLALRKIRCSEEGILNG